MEGAENWRPELMDWLPLTDQDLAKLGMTAVLEAQAKSFAATALKTLEQRTHAEWVKLEGMQFVQLCLRLQKASVGIDDELSDLIRQLDEARVRGHDLRHIVIHASWGLDGDKQAVGYDWRRAKKLDGADITLAMEASLNLRLLAHRLILRVAHLVGDGVLPEGDPIGAAIKMRIGGDRTVTL